MSKNSDILFLNHDARNNVGAALSHMELLTLNHASLGTDENIIAIEENLKHAMELTEKISLSLGEETNTARQDAESSSDLTTYALNDDYFELVKSSYEKLSLMYPIQIDVSTKVREGNYAISVNTEALKALRENLISNAVNAGATKVDAHYEMREYCFVVTLKDNGKGMDEEALDKIILSQHGDGLVHGVGTKSILRTAEVNGFFVNFTSDENGTIYRALCPYAR